MFFSVRTGEDQEEEGESIKLESALRSWGVIVLLSPQCRALAVSSGATGGVHHELVLHGDVRAEVQPLVLVPNAHNPGGAERHHVQVAGAWAGLDM